MKTKTLTHLAMLTAIMLVLGLIERQFVLVPGVPGIKPGLSNIVLMYALCLLGRKEAWLLMGLKVVMGGLLYAGVTGMLYGLAGGVLSLLVMMALYRLRFSLTGVSMAGAAAHAGGQVLMARVLMGSWAAAVQLPLLLVAALITGLINGVTAGLVCRALKKQMKA